MRDPSATLLALALALSGGPATGATGAKGSAQASTTRATEPLTVFAAASLSDVFQEMALHLGSTSETPTIRFNLAGSQQLATQLEHGAKADVFASADQRWMDVAIEKGRIDGAPRTFVHNRLAVIVPASNPAKLQTLANLARPGIKLILAADSVPIGRYSQVLLANLSQRLECGPDFGAKTLANVVSREDNVKAIVSKVALAEADAGIVYGSDITPTNRDRLRSLEIPADANVLASYPIAVVQGSDQLEQARAFCDFVCSPAGQAIFARHGFTPIANAATPAAN